MYKCVCGFSTSLKSNFISHIKCCSKAKQRLNRNERFSDSSFISDDIIDLVSIIDTVQEIESYSSTEESFSGNDGDFDGGGSSDDY